MSNENIDRADAIFRNASATGELQSSFESLGNELRLRSLALRGSNLEHDPELDRSDLARYFASVSNRLSDVFARLLYLHWTEQKLIPEDSDQSQSTWAMFSSLGIKDFHADVASTMDSIAPVIIGSTIGLRGKDIRDLPRFALISDHSNSRNRKELPTDITVIIDSANQWWPAVKTIRDSVIHREHDRIIFGKLGDPLEFQIYDKSKKPLMIDPRLLVSRAHNVVDFKTYSAYVIGNLWILLDDIASVIGAHLGISVDRATPSFRWGSWEHISEGLVDIAG